MLHMICGKCGKIGFRLKTFFDVDENGKVPSTRVYVSCHNCLEIHEINCLMPHEDLSAISYYSQTTATERADKAEKERDGLRCCGNCEHWAFWVSTKDSPKQEDNWGCVFDPIKGKDDPDYFCDTWERCTTIIDHWRKG